MSLTSLRNISLYYFEGCFSKREMKHFLSKVQQSFGVNLHRAKAQAVCAGLCTGWQRQPALGCTGHAPKSHLRQVKCRRWAYELPFKTEEGHVHCHPAKAKVLHTLQTLGLFASISSQYIHSFRCFFFSVLVLSVNQHFGSWRMRLILSWALDFHSNLAWRFQINCSVLLQLE